MHELFLFILFIAIFLAGYVSFTNRTVQYVRCSIKTFSLEG